MRDKVMFPFPSTVEEAFEDWIGVDTWYTGHPADMARFHAYVWWQIYYEGSISEEQLRQKIRDRRKGHIADEDLERVASRLSHLMADCNDFLKDKPAALPFDRLWEILTGVRIRGKRYRVKKQP
ncbi:MAG: hypothetical protein JSS66_00115 [Armatimonadetes bacterium]|nr:hypothetical protein [Armatimonadota bacterium]